ncbi:hypothetical protein DFJ77DRAFT_434622 [Powellomyces hirtus]|nr:hypothetical protein DFJ77DRAFT_434622 [Powellomyces hirtus]
MTTEHAAPTYTNTADLSEEAGDGDDAYLSYEEAEGYNALSPEEILQSVFMDMSMEEIQDLLEANGWNVERTLEALLKPPSESYQPTSDPGRQVCRHFLAGECLRSDCWYSHDPEALVCKFWLAGGCIKGDSCPFTHGGSLMGRAENAGYASSPLASTATKKAQPVATVEDFPALGAPKPASKPKIDFWGPTQKFVDVAKKPPSARPSAVSAAYTAPKPPNRRSTKLVDVKWVSTGDTLAASYLRYRQEAIDAAIQRNKLFQRATEAYLAGNKAAAKAFSLGAHRLNERVQELHRQAGQRIFESRNTTSSIKDGSQTIDLHGLHPDEAVEMVEASIARLKREMFTGRVVIVTGTGNHSRGQKAKVLPAIREYLYRVGLRAQEASMTDGRGGIFTLQI